MILRSPDKRKAALARAVTFFGMVCCICVCVTIAFIAHLVISSSPAPTPRLWVPVVVEANGKQTALGETRQFEFWTPSAKTKDYLPMEAGVVIAQEKWEVVPSDDAVLEFGSILHSNKSVLGYRRVEVWGQGRTKFKPGWWWTITALTNYSAGDLADSYRKYWKLSQGVFIEVVDNRGNKEP